MKKTIAIDTPVTAKSEVESTEKIEAFTAKRIKIRSKT